MKSLEWRAYGIGSRLLPAPEAKDSLEIIAIDEASLEELGEWPWPRSLLAVMVKKLDGANARTIGITLPMDTAQSEFGVRRLDSIRDQYEGKYEKTVKDMLFRARQRLETDGALAVSLKRSANTVLAISYGMNNDRRIRATSENRQQALESYAVKGFNPSSGSWEKYVPSVLTSGLTAVACIAFMADGNLPGRGAYGERVEVESLVSPIGEGEGPGAAPPDRHRT